LLSKEFAPHSRQLRDPKAPNRKERIRETFKHGWGLGRGIFAVFGDWCGGGGDSNHREAPPPPSPAA